MHSPIFFAEATYLALPKTQEHTDTKPKLQYTEIKPNGFFFEPDEVKKLTLQGINVPKVFTC